MSVIPHPTRTALLAVLDAINALPPASATPLLGVDDAHVPADVAAAFEHLTAGRRAVRVHDCPGLARCVNHPRWRVTVHPATRQRLTVYDAYRPHATLAEVATVHHAEAMTLATERARADMLAAVESPAERGDGLMATYAIRVRDDADGVLRQAPRPDRVQPTPLPDPRSRREGPPHVHERRRVGNRRTGEVMTVYTLPTHQRQHHYPAAAPSDCTWCVREDYRRTQAIAANEAARDIGIRQGARPTFVLYDETRQTPTDAHHTARADQLFTWAARAALAAILTWLYMTDSRDLTWVHVMFGLAGIPLAIAAMPLKEQP